MTILFISLLVLAAVAVVLSVVSHTRAQAPSKPYVAPVPLDQPMSVEEAARYAEADGLIARPHFLHYHLTEVYEVEDDQLGVFVGHAKSDPQHDGVVLIEDSDGLLRGRIASQPRLYEQLMASRRAFCYGLVRRLEDGCAGEVCVRIGRP